MSTLLHPVVTSPAFALSDLLAAFVSINDSAFSEHFLYSATRAPYILFFLNPCLYFLMSGLVFFFFLLYLEVTPELILWTPSLSTLITLVLSFSPLLLNSTYELVSPRFTSVALISL